MIPRPARLSLAGIVAFATAATFVANAGSQVPGSRFPAPGTAVTDPADAAGPAATNSFPSAGRPAAGNRFPAPGTAVTAPADAAGPAATNSFPSAGRPAAGNRFPAPGTAVTDPANAVGPAAANPPTAAAPPATNPATAAGPAATNPAAAAGPAATNPFTAGTAVTADLVPAPARESVGDAKRVITGNPLWAIPLKQLSITRDRPIFSPSRRPPPPAVVDRPFVPPPVVRAPPPPRPPERPTLALLGTIAGESDGIALFMETTSQMVVRLRTGEAHEGWVLRSVHGREAQLEKDNRTETVTLPSPGAEAPPPEVPQLPPPMEGVRRPPRR